MNSRSNGDREENLGKKLIHAASFDYGAARRSLS
jgi:hypothetical protein